MNSITIMRAERFAGSIPAASVTPGNPARVGYARRGEGRPMEIAIFGAIRQRFPPGWTKETVVAIFGGVNLDLSSSPPGPGARLTVVAIFGGVNILVPAGARVSVSGFALFGGREVKVSQQRNGPEIKLNLWALLGGIDVKEAQPTAMA
jgi:hypothetical protein